VKQKFRVTVRYVREFDAASTEEAEAVAQSICEAIRSERRGTAKIMQVEQVQRDMSINAVPRRLADGTVKTYYYAWQGKDAPRLKGELGSPEFIASYKRAMTMQVMHPKHFRLDDRGRR
jgi:hypothetical protein